MTGVPSDHAGGVLGTGLAVMAVLVAVEVVSGPGATAGAPAVRGPGPDTLVQVRRAWPVMGTVFEATAVAADSAAGTGAVRAAHRAVARVDSLMSTYREDSEVSRLNAAAGSGRWVRLSRPTARVLEAALAWARRTDGAFDPTVGPLARAWGFHAGRPREPDPAARDSAARLVGWKQVEYRPRTRRARLRRDGMKLDFGAIAKGYALDRARTAMRDAGAAGGMADLGGNVLVFGRTPDGGKRWRLGIDHPREQGGLLGTVVLSEGSVATSGDTRQFFVADGVRYSHIMDARSGRPARGVAQVTVVAREGTASDALSTALFVLGPDAGRRLLAGAGRPTAAGDPSVLWVRDPAGGRIRAGDLVCRGGEAGRIEARLGGGDTTEIVACGRRP